MQIKQTASGFVPIYSIDFTTQSSQNLKASGDGLYSIAGINWLVSNSAQTSTFDILGGTGLRIIRNGSTTFPPRIESNLVNIATGAKVCRWPIVFWARVINNSTGISNTWTHFQIFNAGLGTLQHAYGRINNASTQKWRTANDGTSTILEMVNNLSDDVYVGVVHGQGYGEYYSGVYSGDWPAWSSLTARGVAVFNSTDLSSVMFDTGNNSTNSVAFGVAADEITGGTAACSLTLTHLLIEGIVS